MTTKAGLLKAAQICKECRVLLTKHDPIGVAQEVSASLASQIRALAAQEPEPEGWVAIDDPHFEIDSAANRLYWKNSHLYVRRWDGAWFKIKFDPCPLPSPVPVPPTESTAAPEASYESLKSVEHGTDPAPAVLSAQTPTEPPDELMRMITDACEAAFHQGYAECIGEKHVAYQRQSLRKSLMQEIAVRVNTIHSHATAPSVPPAPMLNLSAECPECEGAIGNYKTSNCLGCHRLVIDALRLHAEALQQQLSGVQALYEGEQRAAAQDRRRAEKAEAALKITEREAITFRERLHEAKAELVALRPVAEAAQVLQDLQRWDTVERCERRGGIPGSGNRLASALADLDKREGKL